MSYDNFEHSIFLGAPIELYKFTYGDGQVYTYTSGDSAIMYDGYQYQPVSIKRSNIELTTEMSRAEVTFEVNRTNKLALLYVDLPPDGNVLVDVYRYHFNDSETIRMWTGRIISVSFKDSKATITAESMYTALKRPGLRAHYQVLCRHQLYGWGCNLAASNYTVQAIITEIVSNTTLRLSQSITNGWAVGGYVEIRGLKRMITNNTGNTIELMQRAPGIAVNDIAIVFAGCDHTLTACTQKFGNNANFGGFPWIPQKNVFNTGFN